MGVRIIRVDAKDRVRVIGLSKREWWSGQYLGDNAFALTDEQLEKIKAEGIPFTETESVRLPR